MHNFEVNFLDDGGSTFNVSRSCYHVFKDFYFCNDLGFGTCSCWVISGRKHENNTFIRIPYFLYDSEWQVMFIESLSRKPQQFEQ